MRTELELLIMLRGAIKSLKQEGVLFNGHCSYLYLFYTNKDISHFEYILLKDYLDTNLAARGESGFCWPPGKLEPRLAWLDEQITKLQTHATQN